MKRVTDLDKFALEEIWRPYQNLAGCAGRLDRTPVSLDETARLLSENTEWSRRVLKRAADIGFCFPSYVHHPLVDTIRTEMLRRAALTEESGTTRSGIEVSPAKESR